MKEDKLNITTEVANQDLQSKSDFEPLVRRKLSGGNYNSALPFDLCQNIEDKLKSKIEGLEWHLSVIKRYKPHKSKMKAYLKMLDDEEMELQETKSKLAEISA